MRVLENIEPKRVMFYFEELTRMPHESGNEKEISDYLLDFAKTNKLEAVQDKALNIIIRKPASKGYENYDAIILQGHMDMVCAKEKDSSFDFNNDALDIFIDEDFIKAKGTTLGADNGIAVAMSLALLEDENAIHPPLEVLFTTEEETGMGGASNVDGSLFSGKTLINIDSEEEGEFCVSCAGGVRVKFNQPFELVENTFEKSYEIGISNLTGGHSGMEINKGRANAIKLLGRVLSHLRGDIGITRLEGGEKMNAIAKRAKAIISSNIDLTSEIEELKEQFKIEFRNTDQNLEISINEIEKEEYMMNTTSQFKLTNVILVMVNGVQTMSSDIDGLVESSTNIGVLSTVENEVVFESAVRSSVDSLKREIIGRLKGLSDLSGGKIALESDYPEWTFNPDSKIRESMKDVYKKMYGNEAKIMAIHAGLECGILKRQIGDIDMISFGPNMWDVHTPDEHVSISSIQRSYEFLKEVLKNI